MTEFDLAGFSKAIADRAEAAAAHTASITVHRHHSASAFHWRDGLYVAAEELVDPDAEVETVAPLRRERRRPRSSAATPRPASCCSSRRVLGALRRWSAPATCASARSPSLPAATTPRRSPASAIVNRGRPFLAQHARRADRSAHRTFRRPRRPLRGCGRARRGRRADRHGAVRTAPAGTRHPGRDDRPRRAGACREGPCRARLSRRRPAPGPRRAAARCHGDEPRRQRAGKEGRSASRRHHHRMERRSRPRPARPHPPARRRQRRYDGDACRSCAAAPTRRWT